jgi:phage tail P2-like protein
MADAQMSLPPALATDPRFKVLGQLALDAFQIDLSPMLVYLVDIVDASILPYLAEQFCMAGDAGALYAGFGPDTEVKTRALLKEAIVLHRFKGTRYSVQRALDLMNVTARITEWHEQTPVGAPYTFLIDLLLTDAPAGQPVLSAERVDAILRMVEFWKPARSGFHARIGVGMSTATRSALVGRPANYIRVDVRPVTHHTAQNQTRSAQTIRALQRCYLIMLPLPVIP